MNANRTGTTLATRLRDDKITATAAPLENDRYDEFPGGTKWDVTLRHATTAMPTGAATATMTVAFYMGSAHTEPPTAEYVLDCLLSDAATVEESPYSFEDWAASLGYDSDSRKAEQTYNACVEQTQRLRAFLGDLYDAYVWETER